jgi:hypothetical protein
MHSARAHLLNTRYDDVIAIVPDEAAVDSCGEVLELVVREMVDAFRNIVIVEGDNVRNTITGESFKWRGTTGRHPIEVAARLALEDLNVLMPINGLDHCLLAWIICRRMS